MSDIVDGLAEKDVVIVAFVPAGDGGEARDERPVMVSVGIKDERTVVKNGRLGDLDRLTREAWAEYAALQVNGGGDEVIASAPINDGDEKAAEAPAFSYDEEWF